MECWSKKPLYFAKELNIKNFQASDDWFDKRKKRFGLILFLFQTLLQSNYSSLRGLSLRILMSFSSAVNDNRDDDTFIPNSSF